MKKLFSILMLATLVVSCRNLDKDAQAIADFKCISFSSEDSLKVKEYSVEIKKIEDKWTGNDLATLVSTADKLFNTKCTAKVEHERKVKELEEQSKKFMDEFVNPNESEISQTSSNYETDAYIKETDAMLDKINHEEDYSTPYNGKDKIERW